MNTLKTALEKITSAVEEMHDDVVFDVRYAHSCVLGLTGMWKTNDFTGLPNYIGTLSSVFGIHVESRFSEFDTQNFPSQLSCYKQHLKGADVCEFLFNGDHMNIFKNPAYTPEQWDVIKLFTSHVGNHKGKISKQNWLSRAYIQLDRL